MMKKSKFASETRVLTIRVPVERYDELKQLVLNSLKEPVKSVVYKKSKSLPVLDTLKTKTPLKKDVYTKNERPIKYKDYSPVSPIVLEQLKKIAERNGTLEK